MTDEKASPMKEKILDAARALWNEKGYAETTMRELARRLGMGVSSLYFYFPSKEAIVLYLYSILNDQAIERFRSEDTGEKDLGKNVLRFLTIKLGLLEPYRSCCVGIFKEAVDPASAISPFSRESTEVLDRSVGLFRELVERAKAAKGDDGLRLARLYWFGHLAIILYWLHDRSEGSKNAFLLAEKLTKGSALLRRFGGFFGRSEIVELVSALFEQAPPDGEPDAAAKADAPARTADVVVIGAGPIGLLYASWLKLRRPRTKILVLDRAPEPGHKIGESTLSGFCKALRSVGIRQDALQRLFFRKNGLGFFHIDRSTPDVVSAPEYVLETFDETFQVERRVLDGLMIANARRLGIEVIQGASVDVDRTTLKAGACDVTWSIGSGTFRARASLVVDASGPAGVLARHLKLHAKEGPPFQTGAVWAYFDSMRRLADLPGWTSQAQFPRDEYTQHLCFPEGWLWVIPIVSWQESPSANLERMHHRLLSSAGDFPSRKDLAAEFGCPHREITSVGLVLRSDRDARLRDDARGAFEHYSSKVPAIRRLLDGARLMEDPYSTGETFMSRLNMRGHASRVAGDGWLLVGDAAFFVDPLISPGLTGGSAQAWRAAVETARALDSGNVNEDAFSGHQTFVIRLHEALERDNQIVYMSFNHPEALALVQRFQEIHARRHFNQHEDRDYGDDDTNVWGILNPSYVKLQKRAWSIMRDAEQAVGAEVPVAEQSPRDYEPMVRRLRKLLGVHVDGHEDLTPYVTQNR